jgi:hypothetical protein
VGYKSNHAHAIFGFTDQKMKLWALASGDWQCSKMSSLIYYALPVAASHVTSGLTLTFRALLVRPEDWTVHMRQLYTVREDIDSKVLKADVRRGRRSAVG